MNSSNLKNSHVSYFGCPVFSNPISPAVHLFLSLFCPRLHLHSVAMKRRKGSIGSRSKRVAGKVDDELESQQLGASFADLPFPIIADILLRLPVKSIGICKCVCTSWKAVISDPNFAKLHFQQAQTGFMIRATAPHLVSRVLHLLDFEPEMIENDDDDDDDDDGFCCCESFSIQPECNCHLKLEQKFKLPLRGVELVLDKRDESERRAEDDKFAVVNSCNGLLCLSDFDFDYFVVCNPITGEFIRLPDATRVDNTCSIWKLEWHLETKICCGFGFQPKTNEYKVVRILNKHGGFQATNKSMVVEMHTLGTSTWKNVDVDSRDFRFLGCPLNFKCFGFPTCVSGALHWIRIGLSHNAILSFDFGSERFQSFPSPPHLFDREFGTRDITMGELRGSLYICDSSSLSSVKMWIMKKYGFGESWTNVFSIDTMGIDRWPYGGLYWPVKHFKNGAAILMYHSSNCFIYYEPEKYGFKFFKVRGTQDTFEVIPHIPNLISLKDAVKGDDIEVLNVHSRCGKFKLREENEVLFLANVNAVLLNSIFISLDDEE